MPAAREHEVTPSQLSVLCRDRYHTAVLGCLLPATSGGESSSTVIDLGPSLAPTPTFDTADPSHLSDVTFSSIFIAGASSIDIAPSPSLPSQSSSATTTASLAPTASPVTPPTWEIAVAAVLGCCVLALCILVGLWARRRRRNRLHERAILLDLEKDVEEQTPRFALSEDATQITAQEQDGEEDPARVATSNTLYPAALSSSWGATAGTVLSMPDPARDLVRAGQQRALDKLVHEQERQAAQPKDPFADLTSPNVASSELPSGSAPVSPTEADSATVVSGDTADLDLRSQFSLLRRRLLAQEMQLNQVTLVAERLAHREEQRELAVGPTVAVLDVPPAYYND